MIENIIRSLKRDNNYNIDKTLSMFNLNIVIIRRSVEALRGFLYKPFIEFKGILFIGRRTTIRHANKISFGKSCIINDNVFIDALSVNGVQFGSNCTLGYGCRFIATDILRSLGHGIKIGNNSAIGSNSFIQGAGGITIGDDVIMGPNVYIYTLNHNYKDNSKLIRLQGEEPKPVVIEDDCWIGSNSIILPGVRIRSRTVIAAGSIVSKDTIGNCVISNDYAKIKKEI